MRLSFKGRFASVTALCVTALCMAPRAYGWQILSAMGTKPCHERLAIGSLGAKPPPWGLDASEVQGTFRALVDKLKETGVPRDEFTHAFVNDVAKRYSLTHFSEEERFVLASIVVGAREPDSDGFALLRLREIRGEHLREERQATHFLRRRTHDGDAGNRAAVEEARALILSKIESSWASWTGRNARIDRDTWTFPFYGDSVKVFLFEPAFLLGYAMHVTQDAYTHTIMDEDFNILSVGNYLDPVLDTFNETRDGPAHSKRMDKCEVDKSPFDGERYTKAMRSSLALVNLALDSYEEPEFPREKVAARLAELLPLREGCTTSNSYCGTPWNGPSHESPEKPFNLLSACSVGAAGMQASAARGPWWRGWSSLAFDLSVMAAGAAFIRRLVR